VKAAGAGAGSVVWPHYYDPPSGIRVELDIEGQQSVQTLPGTNQLVTVSWDGRDAYGRLVGGTHLANINIAYEFTEWNYVGGSFSSGLLSQFPALFGNDGNVIAFEGHAGSTLGVGALFQRLLTYPDHRKLGLGGWSPTPLHRLDPAGGILYYGDGRIRKVPEQSLQDDFLNRIYAMSSMTAATPDGAVYFSGHLRPYNDNHIFRRNPGGGYQLITASRQSPGSVIIAWNGLSSVDGLPTDRVVMDATLTSMSAGPDGSLYVTDNSVIARLAPDGIWHVVMGLHAAAPAILQPDGTSAAESFASYSGGVLLAVGPDSSVYYTASWPYYAPGITGTNYTLVRKIAPDGRIYTVFGGGGVATTNYSPSWQDLFGTAACGAHFASVNPLNGLAVGNDGTVYVSDDFGQYTAGIFQISPGGVILPFLNGMPRCEEGHYDPNPADTNTTKLIQGDQGKRATDVTTLAWGPYQLQVGQDASVYFTDTRFVWRVNPNGIVERIAGRYINSVSPSADLPTDNGDPLNTDVYPVTAMALTSDGSLFIVRGTGSGTPPIVIIPGRSSLRGIIAPFSSQILPSEDGSEVYAFDPAGRHLQTLDSLTGATKWAFGYDANSLVVTMTDVAGQVTQIERNAAGQATAIVGPHGQRTSLGMDSNGFLGAVTNPAHEATLLTNSSGGSLLSITGPRGATYSVAYDNMGRVTNVSDPLGGGWVDSSSDNGVQGDYSYEIDVNGTNSLGETLSRKMVLQPNGDTYVYSSLGGHPTESGFTRLNGDSSSYFSDGISLYSGMGADPRFGNQARQPVRQVLSLPNGLVYNASMQRSVGLTNPADPLSLTGLTNAATINGRTYTQTYNATNRTLTLTSPEGRKTTAIGDAMGRIIHASTAGQSAMDFAFDGSGRLLAVTNVSSAGAAQTLFGYDALGRLNALTDPLGRTNGYGYDAAGRWNRLVISDGAVAGFTQDSEGNLTSVTPPGRSAHMFHYNAVGLLTQYTPPLVEADESVNLQYDSERNLTSVSLPDGQTVNLKNGLGGRLEQATLGGGPTLTYQYGSNTGSGYLMPVAVTSTTGDSLKLAYVGSIVTNETWSGSITGQVSLELNSDLVPVSTSVDGAAVAYVYDADLLLKQAGALSLTRDSASGLIVGTSLGGVTDQRQFDDRGLLTNYLASANGTSTWSITLSRDILGRITNRIETLGGATTEMGYVYDLAGRLQEIWQAGTLIVAYTYDANGNRLTRNGESSIYDAQDRLQTRTGSVFEWSPNGDLRAQTSSGQRTAYSYDVRGSLTAVAPPAGPTISYTLDAAGRRIGKQVGGTLQRGWLWSDDLPVAELDSHSVVALRFVYAADRTTPSYVIKGSTTYRIFSDERGSVRLVINVADSSIAQRLDYDEFGRVLLDTNPGFQPFGFAGGLYDSDTGLVRFGARDYSAQMGQWMARDPIDFGGGQFSLYAYVGNDPLNTTDPIGLGPQPQPPSDGPERNPPDLVGKIVQIKAKNKDIGTSVLVKRKGTSHFEPLGLDAPVYMSDVLKTDKNTVFAIEFIIGGRVGVNVNSSVKVNGERSVEDAEFNPYRIILRKGGMWAKTGKLKEPLEIQTNGGVIGIKG
jgi:RHS repeat-associated protein